MSSIFFLIYVTAYLLLHLIPGSLYNFHLKFSWRGQVNKRIEHQHQSKLRAKAKKEDFDR
jgi:hypothetical protein